MKKIFVIIIAVLIATASIATAASPQDVEAFQSTLHRNRKSLSKWKKTGEGWVMAVYVIKGKKYVVYYQGGGPRIQFDIWPNKSKNSRLSVNSTDGIVTSGEKFPSKKRYFWHDEGLENKRYWQKVHDAAIADTIKHFQ